jgi:hypothetical protein
VPWRPFPASKNATLSNSAEIGAKTLNIMRGRFLYPYAAVR